MPFKISDFKTTLDKYGGLARTSLFEVRIDQFPVETGSGLTERDIRLFCSSVNFPGINIENGQFSAVAQLTTQFPLEMTSAPITANFMVDSDHQVLQFFHNWIQRVLNFSTKDGSFAAIDGEFAGGGQMPFEMGYKDDYACRVTIRHYSTESFSNDDKYYEVVLENVYPYSIGDLALDWDSQNSFLTMPVTFAYDRIWYSGDKTGKPSRRTNGGFLETLSNLAGVVDVLKQTKDAGRPTSIQDAVNRLTRVRNSWDRLTGD